MSCDHCSFTGTDLLQDACCLDLESSILSAAIARYDSVQSLSLQLQANNQTAEKTVAATLDPNSKFVLLRVLNN